MRRLRVFATPRAFVAAFAALTVAAATATVVGSDLAALHRRAQDLGPETPVVVAARDLALGEVVDESALASEPRYAAARPQDALNSVAETVGRVVAVPLVRGAVVQQAHLAPTDRTGLTGLIPRGMRAMRVEPVDGLRPPLGAVVDVLAAVDPTLGGASTAVVAQAARVLAVDRGHDDEYTGGGRAGVTLLVTEDEAQRVAFAVANGVLTLALAPPEDACCGSPTS